jgi:hypothetical protein
MSNSQTIYPCYAPLVEACKAHGISRTVAFSMIQGSDPLLASFLIGARRYVYLESLQTLPQRLAERGGK